MDLTLLAAEPPARGAGLNQVIGLSIAAMIIGAVDVVRRLGASHAPDHLVDQPLREWLGSKFDRPSWVALPVLVFTTSIICALFGFIWDVSWHIGNGRDPGPLANPAHYFIIIGLFGIFVAGMFGRGAAVRQAGAGSAAHHPQLARAGRRVADGGLRNVRDDRLPARRHLASHLRPGRDAVGPNPSDDDRRRQLLPVRGADAGVRGRAIPAGRRAPTVRSSEKTVPSSESCAICPAAGC